VIAVIADDLAGAAEVAGVAHARGLSAEVCTQTGLVGDADLAAVDSDTRSLPADEAALCAAESARSLLAARPAWLFKKVDSVLRGPVAAELESVMEAAGKARALLVPANPLRGRTICRGRYFVHGRALAETEFAADPEHPAATDDLALMLAKSGRGQIHVLRGSMEMPSRGIVVPDVAGPADLGRWAVRVDDQTLAAGAAEFFDAMMTARTGTAGHVSPPLSEPECPGKTLFVCGSATAWTRVRKRQCHERRLPVVPMPEGLLEGESGIALLDEWARAAIRTLRSSPAIMLAIDAPAVIPAVRGSILRDHLAEASARVLSGVQVSRLNVEGGATAAEIRDRMGWHRLAVIGQDAPGVVTLRVPHGTGPWFCIKPGSYEWPAAVWQRAMP